MVYENIIIILLLIVAVATLFIAFRQAKILSMVHFMYENYVDQQKIDKSEEDFVDPEVDDDPDETSDSSKEEGEEKDGE